MCTRFCFRKCHCAATGYLQPGILPLQYAINDNLDYGREVGGKELMIKVKSGKDGEIHRTLC